MPSKWGNPINLRFHADKDREIRVKAREKGLTVGMYIRTVVYKELAGAA